MQIDTSKPFEIAQDRSVPAFVLILCLLGVAYGVWEIRQDRTPTHTGNPQVLAWALILVLAPTFLAGLFRLILGSKDPVRLSPHGFSDPRSFAGVIPWSAIVEMREIRIRRIHMIRFILDRRHIDDIEFTRFGRFPRSTPLMVRMAHQVDVTALGLHARHQDITSLVQDYLSTHHPEAVITR